MRILMVYIEPAPYILDLIRVLQYEYPSLELRVFFISKNISQPWKSNLDANHFILLPQNRFLAIKQLLLEIRGGDFHWLHLAGWGHPVLLCSLLLGKLFLRNISMESDTQLPVNEKYWKSIVKKLLYTRLFSLVKIFFPGGTRQEAYFTHFKVPDDKIKIAQMTVDVNKIHKHMKEARESQYLIRKQWQLSHAEFIYLYVGRLDNFKGGIIDLITAFNQLKQEAGTILVFVGDGNLRYEVENAVRENSNIFYMGRFNSKEVYDMYAIADVLVLPSHFDNWGLVINEAIASALPVIVTERVGCCEDLVIQGETGLIVDTGDYSQLRDAMLCLKNDSLLRNSMKKNSLQLSQSWTLEVESEIMMRAWSDAL